jgi:uncharacterized lipoprotein
MAKRVALLLCLLLLAGCGSPSEKLQISEEFVWRPGAALRPPPARPSSYQGMKLDKEDDLSRRPGKAAQVLPEI